MGILQKLLAFTPSTKMADIFSLIIILDNKIFAIPVRYINVPIGSDRCFGRNIFLRLTVLSRFFWIIQRHKDFPINCCLNDLVTIIIADKQNVLSIFIEEGQSMCAGIFSTPVPKQFA